jgi:hypothetical protein
MKRAKVREIFATLYGILSVHDLVNGVKDNKIVIIVSTLKFRQLVT